MASFTVTRSMATPSGTVSKNTTYTGASLTEIDESIAVGTDTAIACAIDVSAVKAFWISSDAAVTIETNSGSAADDTLSLVANVPYVWHTSDYNAFLLGTDVTVLYVTNASGGAATISLRVLQDPTP